MNQWIHILEYRDFSDIPRVFIVVIDGRFILFDCPFDAVTDEFPDKYSIYEIPNLAENNLPRDWTTLPGRTAIHIGTIRTDQVVFDPTRRKQIDIAAIRHLL